jgi:hypothetical protein
MSAAAPEVSPPATTGCRYECLTTCGPFKFDFVHDDPSGPNPGFVSSCLSGNVGRVYPECLLNERVDSSLKTRGEVTVVGHGEAWTEEQCENFNFEPPSPSTPPPSPPPTAAAGAAFRVRSPGLLTGTWRVMEVDFGCGTSIIASSPPTPIASTPRVADADDTIAFAFDHSPLTSARVKPDASGDFWVGHR